MEKKNYSYDEAYGESLKYFQGDELAARVWVNKYAVKDSFGNIYEKSPEDMHWRIANEVARIEAKYPNPLSSEELFGLLDHFKYIVPQGSPMTGIGNNYQVASLSNCFVIGVDGEADSYGAIFKIDEEQVQLMKRRGGVGHDLSHIRPKGSPVKNSALTSTGLVPFMERYSNSTREVAQDGRRGALMLSVSIKHPDSEAFIDAKMTEGKVTGANVSVKLTDDFMQAAIEGKPYTQQYPIDATEPAFQKDIDASALWKKIVHNAWKSAEPGVLFWDTILKESVPDCYADLGYRTVSTNPCGEIPLCPYDSCRLLAINLYSYVVNPFKPDAYFDFELFKKHVALAQRIMDDIIDLELEKIERIEVDEEDNSALRLKFPPASRSGNYPVICEDVRKAYGSHVVFHDVNLTINRGEKVAFVGKNGEGKSTLVKCIMDEIDFEGKLTIGHNVQIGYFAQNQAQMLDENLTVFDTIDRVATGDIRLKIRDILGAFMFGGEASDKKVKVLSGGERTRLAMIKLLLEPVNLLILDEPTNHLDMRSKDVLKEAIREFDGTVILVSHDRDFLDGLATKVYEFGGGLVKEHLGGIYEFLQKKKIDSLNELQKGAGLSASPTASAKGNEPETVQPSENKLSYEAQKELNKKIKKLERQVADCEASIEETESAIAIVEAKMATPEGASDMQLYERHQKLKQQLDGIVEEWERVSMELEETKN